MAHPRTSRVEYVHEIPYGLRKELCDILEADTTWSEIPALLGYSTDHILRFGKQSQPFDSFLQHWSHACPTVKDLFILLVKCQQIRAVSLIAHLVPPQIKNKYPLPQQVHPPAAAAAAGPSQSYSIGSSQSSIVDNRWYPAYNVGGGGSYNYAHDEQWSPGIAPPSYRSTAAQHWPGRFDGSVYPMNCPPSPTHAASGASPDDMTQYAGIRMDGARYDGFNNFLNPGVQSIPPSGHMTFSHQSRPQMRPEYMRSPEQSHHQYQHVYPGNQQGNLFGDKSAMHIPAPGGHQFNQPQMYNNQNKPNIASPDWQQMQKYNIGGNQMVNQGHPSSDPSHRMLHGFPQGRQNQAGIQVQANPGSVQVGPVQAQHDFGDSRPRHQLRRTFSQEPGEYVDVETLPVTSQSPVPVAAHGSPNTLRSIRPGAPSIPAQGGSLRSYHVQVASMPSVPNEVVTPHRPDSITAAKEQAKNKDEEYSGGMQFEFIDIQKATSDFDETNLIGQGGFGKVYHGKMLGTKFAFKIMDKAKTISIRGADHLKRELSALRRFQHPNIVTMSGYAVEGSQLCLVFEFMQQGSLEDRLACKDGSEPLTWQIRYRILHDAASGLRYLHEAMGKSLIHGDIKSANILLTKNFDAKLSDFGLAQEATSGEKTNEFTHVTLERKERTVQMTPAYYPTDFYVSGALSTSTDIHCMGVVMMEVCTGQKCVNEARATNLKFLKNYICHLYKKLGMESGLVELQKMADPNASDWPFTFWDRLMLLALDCTKSIKNERPNVVQVMETLSDALQEVEKLQEMGEFSSQTRKLSQDASSGQFQTGNPELQVTPATPVVSLSYGINDAPDEIDLQKMKNKQAAALTPSNDSGSEFLQCTMAQEPESIFLQRHYDELNSDVSRQDCRQPSLPDDTSKMTSSHNFHQDSLEDNNSQPEYHADLSGQNHMESIGKKPSFDKNVGLEEMYRYVTSSNCVTSISPTGSGSESVLTRADISMPRCDSIQNKHPSSMQGFESKVVSVRGSIMHPAACATPRATDVSSLSSAGEATNDRAPAVSESRNESELNQLQEIYKQQPGKTTAQVDSKFTCPDDPIPAFSALGLNSDVCSGGFSHGSSGVHQTMMPMSYRHGSPSQSMYPSHSDELADSGNQLSHDQCLGGPSSHYQPNITQSSDLEDTYPLSLISYANTPHGTCDLDEYGMKATKTKKVILDNYPSGEVVDDAACYDTQELKLDLDEGFYLK